MRNLTDIQIFEKILMIFRSSAVENRITDSVKPCNPSFDVKFFPEGGSLVSSITCSVAFKATDETGKGCNVSGDVFASTGRHIASFQTAHKGMGRFYFRPVDGLSYYAVIKTPDGKTIRKDLPQSSSKGFTLNVSDYLENGPLITIRTNQATLETLADQVHFITVTAHKRVVSTLGFSINSISTSFRLPLDDLSDGIVQLTLINSDELPLCERLIFHNRNKVKIEVRTDKSVYNKRSVVNVGLTLKGDSIEQDNAFLSMSAAEAGFLNSDNKLNSNISSWFLLESDIRGIIEDPAQYFDPGNPDRTRNLDLLLCTHGWRDFKWKYEKPVFYPEYGITISGKVRNPASENQRPNVFINAILRKEKNQLMMTSLADSSGKFSFEELDFTGSARLIATAMSDNNASNQLFIDTVIYPSLKTDPGLSRISLVPGQDLIPEDKGSYAENEFIIRRDLSKKFLLSDTILLGEVTVVGRKKRDFSGSSFVQPAYVVQRVAVGIPDVVLKVKPEDERYSSFRDIIRKGISGVRVEVPNEISESGIRIRGSSLEPLFMLDGIPVPYSMVGDFPVKWIERIDIMKSGGIATSFSQSTNNDKSLDSDPKYNGVISIITKPEEKRKAMMPVYNSVNRTVKGFDAPIIF
ncbi:MAG: TonB-dependent receptor plug domain-containing protein, partial [Bacteroidia bacterium]|nr:TonB-dependent receptor plug domain-containing protein [Bacteroidia bacterium]